MYKKVNMISIEVSMVCIPYTCRSLSESCAAVLRMREDSRRLPVSGLFLYAAVLYTAAM